MKGKENKKRAEIKGKGRTMREKKRISFEKHTENKNRKTIARAEKKTKRNVKREKTRGKMSLETQFDLVMGKIRLSFIYFIYLLFIQ